MKDPRGWLLLVGLATSIGLWVMWPGGTRTVGGENGPCLTHRDCAQSLRCYGVPKDDPFVVQGTCRARCEGDAGCAESEQCAPAAERGGQLAPKADGGLWVCVPAPKRP